MHCPLISQHKHVNLLHQPTPYHPWTPSTNYRCLTNSDTHYIAHSFLNTNLLIYYISQHHTHHEHHQLITDALLTQIHTIHCPLISQHKHVNLLHQPTPYPPWTPSTNYRCLTNSDTHYIAHSFLNTNMLIYYISQHHTHHEHHQLITDALLTQIHTIHCPLISQHKHVNLLHQPTPYPPWTPSTNYRCLTDSDTHYIAHSFLNTNMLIYYISQHHTHHEHHQLITDALLTQIHTIHCPLISQHKHVN